MQRPYSDIFLACSRFYKVFPLSDLYCSMASIWPLLSGEVVKHPSIHLLTDQQQYNFRIDIISQSVVYLARVQYTAA